jgi:hypothetical protein
VCGDLVVAESPGQMLEHLVLAVAELGEEHARGGGWASRVGGDATADVAADDRSSRGSTARAISSRSAPSSR